MNMNTLKLSISLFLSMVFLFSSCRNSSESNNQNNPSSKYEANYLQKIDSLKNLGYPMEDLHVHLKGGLSIEEAVENSKATGITYGIAANCGIGFPITNDTTLMEYFHSLEGYPVYKALQAEGREWINLFSKDSVDMFDYAFTDAMTFTDNKGRRTRLWMKDEVWVEDKQQFMDMLVDRIVGIMENEPVQIYVNSTFLPEVISNEYDELWTPERMDKVITAAVENDIAIEINARYKIPSSTFIMRAKAAGVKFTMGTNNTDKNLGLLQYCIDMIEECGLEPGDFYRVHSKL
jgi:hypothetical protein